MYTNQLLKTRIARYDLEPLRTFLYERLHFEGTLTACDVANRPTKQVYGYLTFEAVHVKRSDDQFERMQIPLTRKQYAMIYKYMIAGLRYEFTARIDQSVCTEELIQDGVHYPVQRKRIHVHDVSLHRLKPVGMD